MLAEVKSPLDKLKAQPRERFDQLGIEGYRHLKRSRLSQRMGSMAGAGEVLSISASPAIVMVNGRFSPALSKLPEGVVALPLEQAITTYGAFLQSRWKQWLKDETDPMALLNGAEHIGGVLLYIPPKRVIAEPIRILNLVTGMEECEWSHARLHLFLGASSEAVVACESQVLDGRGCMLNQVWDLHLEQNASLTWEQTSIGLPSDCWSFTALRAQLKRDSQLTTVSRTDGTECVREDAHITLAESGAQANLNAAWMLKDKNEAHYRVLMHHQAPHCNSSQLFKGVLSDFSRSSFCGKIYVDKEAQKTDAFQLNRNLLLSERAHAACEPCLEIFADDVKASHGATIGRLNDEQLMYLQARGIDPKTARELLVKAYLRDITDQFSALPGGFWQ